MIYLIGGPPRCGKTTVAKKLSSRLNIPWISADTLEGIARAYTPDDEVAEKFPKNAVRIKTGKSNDIMYSRYTEEEIAELYIKQSRATFPAIEACVEGAVAESEDYIIDYIIEGHQVHPEIIRKMSDRYIDQVKGVVLIRQDIENTVSDCRKSKAANDWFLKKTKNEETYVKIAKMIIAYGKFLEKEAAKFNISARIMDGDFFKNTESVIEQLIK